MKSITTKHDSSQPVADTAVYLFDDWFDPIEAVVRDRVRGFIQAMIEGELGVTLERPRYGRHPQSSSSASDGRVAVIGHRHGHRSRSLMGTFGRIEIEVPRARLNGPGGKTTEWNSQMLRAYQRRTLAADALIASTYLAGTNTRRVRRALKALFGGAVGKDTVSRVWRKVKADWDAWNARSLAAEPIVRLILDGTVVDVRLDRKATTISLLVVIGVRTDGQKVFPDRGWRARTREGHRRGLGWRAGPTLHRAQAPEPARPCARASARGGHRRLHGHDLRRDTGTDRGPPQGLHPQVAAQVSGGGR